MATTFFVRTKKKTGYASVCVRVQSSVLGVNIRQSTRLKADVQKWNLPRSTKAFENYVESREGRYLFKKIEQIRVVIDQRIVSGKSVSAEQVRDIIYRIVYGDCEMSAEKMVGKYISHYLDQAKTGARKTCRGVNFSEGTLKTIRSLESLYFSFVQKMEKDYGFDEVDYNFRTEFMSFLYEDKGYNVNTTAKYVNSLITILAAAEAEGLHNNRRCLNRYFRVSRVEVDSVYLSKEELVALVEVDISHLSRMHEVVRDIFMVGVYTAQRVSDYNHIGPENIITGADGSVFINIRQRKTGVWVSIPVKRELEGILEKYGYVLPHVSEHTINSCIKTVAQVAGIDSPVVVESTSRGVSVLETRPKYELIHSHTARRTGATLMYLAGMNVFNICSVTGHSSTAMLKKYIKADGFERARTISSDAAFEKW